MTRMLIYFLLAAVFLVCQIALLPWLLPYRIKPDLLLVLVVYLSLHENFLAGSATAYGLGCLQDVFAGSYLGLYGLAFLATFLAGRSLAARLNTESSLLLLLMVGGGTLLEGLVLIFALGFFADAGVAWLIVLRNLPLQAVVNLVAGLLLLKMTLFLQKRLAPRIAIPGLQHLDDRRES